MLFFLFFCEFDFPSFLPSFFLLFLLPRCLSFNYKKKIFDDGTDCRQVPRVEQQLALLLPRCRAYLGTSFNPPPPIRAFFRLVCELGAGCASINCISCCQRGQPPPQFDGTPLALQILGEPAFSLLCGRIEMCQSVSERFECLVRALVPTRIGWGQGGTARFGKLTGESRSFWGHKFE